MYSILIAEDEKIERDVIRWLIQENGFDLKILEADNGRQALQILSNEPVDILLTDIRMPFMTGLELAEHARKHFPDIALIFFSSYSDFDYVKKALSLQAANYITKPVDPDEFRATLSEVLQVLQFRKNQQIEKSKQLHALQNHILYKLINKTSLSSLMAFYPQLDFSFVQKIRRLLFLQLERDFFSEIDSEDTIFSADHFAQLLPANSYFINLNPAQSVLVIADENHSLGWYEELSGRISSHLQNCYQLNCHIEISEPFRPSDSLSTVCEEAERKVADRFFSSAIPSSAEQTDEISVLDDSVLRLLRSDVQMKNPEQLTSHVRQILNCMKDTSKVSLLYTRFFCTSMLSILLDGFSQEKRKNFDEYAGVIAYALQMTPIESLLLSLAKELSATFQFDEASASQVMHLTKQYIHNHYAEELSLEILAGKVYLSPNHLSKLFIRQNGYGINKYIKKVRMEKAKELLLNTNLPINEIAKRIGYSSASYFCKSFAKDYEISPEKFRNEIHS